jgi:uncharacterized membrane protein
MKHRQFVAQLDRKVIETAIRAAESRTSGEICVIIHHEPVVDAVAVARGEFIRRGMQKTLERNAVLILVAPASQNFAVIGDEAVHQKCGEEFWPEMVAAMSGLFKQGRFTEGLVQGIERAGTLLAKHFPHRPDDQNELPDRVVMQ